MTERPLRSALKAVSWRVVGTIDTFTLSFLVISFLGPLIGRDPGVNAAANAATAGYIALTEVVTKIALYYLHERGWSHVLWGRAETASGRLSDLPRRSLVKTATWRLLASLDTFVLAFIFTGDVGVAASIGGLEVISKMILYFLHERVWSRIGRGAE